MQPKLVWQYGSNSPENSSNLDEIRRWWGKLSGTEILWQQRMVPDSGSPDDLDWEPQRFDDRFALTDPELKGITIYWRKPDESELHNITASTLELDRDRQRLYVYPKSRPNVAIRVGVPELTYDTTELKATQVQCVTGDDKGLLVFRDENQLVEVKVKLDAKGLAALKSQL